MAHFNEKKPPEKNLAGGRAYRENANMQLAAVLLTSFGNDKYYASNTAIKAQLARLIEASDKEFAAKAIVYARREFGMRTITHYAASILAKYIGGEPWAKDFFNSVIVRPDDMTEIVACTLSRKEKLSNAMKKGFAEAFGKFSRLQLAKYRSEDSTVKLVDLVNLCHPKQTAKNDGAIEALVKSELRLSGTWESEVSAAGNDPEAKKKAWRDLVLGGKLGYFALLRNLRNIVQCGDEEMKAEALKQLTVPADVIRKSRVLPFRFSTAYKELSTIDRDAMRAISRACEIACSNVPKFPGKTLVALDVSGSMISNKVDGIAALFAAVLLKTNDCDLIKFAEQANYQIVNPDDSVLTIANSITFPGGGTNFVDVFRVADGKKYDRVILLSDMQAWVAKDWLGRDFSPSAAYNLYKNRNNVPHCKCYSIDLAGYGTLQLPEKDVYCLAGFSEKIFDIMGMFEEDKNALITTIQNVKLK